MNIRMRLAVACLAWPMVVGCGSGSFEEQLVTAKQEHRVAAGGTSLALRLPVAEPFNVADTARASTGEASAVSNANAGGTANCSADATGGGDANAEFHLGHVLHYDGSKPQNVEVAFDVNYDCTARNFRSLYGVVPVQLKAYVMDSNRQVLASVTLAESDPERVPEKWSGSESPAFELTFEPGLAYHMVVAGRVEATWIEGEGSASEVKINACEIRVVPRG